MVKILLILLSAVACVLGATIPEGMLPQMDGRIVGGSATTINKYPWQASVQRSGAHSCGGAIYNNYIIVTAAHCLLNINPSELKVRVGSTNWSTGGDLMVVSKIKTHEQFDPITMANDIAVIRLQYGLVYGSNIQKISIPSSWANNGYPAVVTGWGTGEYGLNGLSTDLQAVDVDVIPQSICASYSYGYGTKILPMMLCASAPGKDACQGDSGSPLVSGIRLVGIVSWGYGCAFGNYPGVYTNTAYLYTWITNAAANI